MNDGSGTGWAADHFDAQYREAARDAGALPWANLAPHPMLTGWLGRRAAPPGRAVVVACGLGDDAEALADAGWEVAGFDISAEAVAWCRERFPDSPVDYRVADLFDLPGEWERAFDLVVEIWTIQSIPAEVHAEAMRRIAALVADAGTLLLATIGRADPGPAGGPPWPLHRADLGAVEAAGLIEQAFSAGPAPWPGFSLFEVEYCRGPGA